MRGTGHCSFIKTDVLACVARGPRSATPTCPPPSRGFSHDGSSAGLTAQFLPSREGRDREWSRPCSRLSLAAVVAIPSLSHFPTRSRNRPSSRISRLQLIPGVGLTHLGPSPNRPLPRLFLLRWWQVQTKRPVAEPTCVGLGWGGSGSRLLLPFTEGVSVLAGTPWLWGVGGSHSRGSGGFCIFLRVLDSAGGRNQAPLFLAVEETG